MNKTQLYLITPAQFELGEFLPKLRDAFEGGGVACLQLRMKKQGSVDETADIDEMRIAAKEILPICREYGVQFIINDRAELVNEIGADGVHVGSDDMSVARAREIVGENKVVGASCYGDVDLAIDAGVAGADYVAFGQFYETSTKPPKGRPTTEILEFWNRNSILPCVAIGGITPENVAPIVKAGADFIAVVSGVWQHPKGAKKAVEEYLAVINKESISA